MLVEGCSTRIEQMAVLEAGEEEHRNGQNVIVLGKEMENYD